MKFFIDILVYFNLKEFVSLSVGSRYLPRFETLVEGFTSLKMVNRDKGTCTTPPPPSSRTPTHPYNWEKIESFSSGNNKDLDTG